MNEESLRTNDYINEVLSKYSDMVYRLALSQTKNKADAEDVFQEVFTRYMPGWDRSQANSTAKRGSSESL
ncbi:RNA polymerase sigma factor [Paenibacillaceae bacterium WGS1546]|uniref:RNA polymerase sigma factor n=1 Tax=Cohnella sp. WGS1546 TaxID=3366810 RepID=UPI00372D7C25